MGLSTNILWHQTNNEGIKNIIENKRFVCSYSLETIFWKRSNRKIAFPMISFCDIPFSDMHEYLLDKEGKMSGKYGKYTIGMKREWGKAYRLSPVWYRDKDSNSLRSQMDSYKEIEDKSYEKYSNMDKLLWFITANTKNHDGNLSKYQISSYRFFDEHECRFVPDFDCVMGNKKSPSLSEEQYKQYKEENGSSLICDIHIPFTVKDISYILVSQANQIKRIKKLFGNEDISQIVFLSYSQIVQDIIGINHSIEKI